MKKGLTEKELKELLKVFCPKDVEMILSKFSVTDIRKVINHPTIEK